MDNKLYFLGKKMVFVNIKMKLEQVSSEVQKTSIKLMQSPRETTAQVLEKRETDEKEEKNCI